MFSSVCMIIWIWMCKCMHISFTSVCVHLFVSVSVCVWVYMCVYTCVYACGLRGPGVLECVSERVSECVSECMCAYTHVCTRTRCAWVALGTCFSAEWFPFTSFTSFQTPSCAPASLRGLPLKDARCWSWNQSMSNVWVFTWNVILRSRPSRHMKGAPRPQTCVKESSSCPSPTTQLLRLFLSQLSLCLFLWLKEVWSAAYIDFRANYCSNSDHNRGHDCWKLGQHVGDFPIKPKKGTMKQSHCKCKKTEERLFCET